MARAWYAGRSSDHATNELYVTLEGFTDAVGYSRDVFIYLTYDNGIETTTTTVRKRVGGTAAINKTYYISVIPETHYTISAAIYGTPPSQEYQEFWASGDDGTESEYYAVTEGSLAQMIDLSSIPAAPATIYRDGIIYCQWDYSGEPLTDRTASWYIQKHPTRTWDWEGHLDPSHSGYKFINTYAYLNGEVVTEKSVTIAGNAESQTFWLFGFYYILTTDNVVFYGTPVRLGRISIRAYEDEIVITDGSFTPHKIRKQANIHDIERKKPLIFNWDFTGNLDDDGDPETINGTWYFYRTNTNNFSNPVNIGSITSEDAEADDYTYTTAPIGSTNLLTWYIWGRYYGGVRNYWSEPYLFGTLEIVDKISNCYIFHATNENDGDWLQCTPYIFTNGDWHEASSYLFTNGDWHD